MKIKKFIVITLLLLISLFIVDRYLWMPERIKQLWIWESGIGLGDPISYSYDFEVNGSEIIFKNYKLTKDFPKVAENRKSKFYLFGCYFGKLYIYDTVKNRMATYSNNSR